MSCSSLPVARYRHHFIFGLERKDVSERHFDVEIRLRLSNGQAMRAEVLLPDGDIQDVNGPWPTLEAGFDDARRWAENRLRSSGR